MSSIWQWLAWGEGILRILLPYATFVGVAYTTWTFWRSRRKVSIYAVNDDSPGRERREIARVPASLVSRAEVNGLVAQAAAGHRLDLSRFVFHYPPGKIVEVPLPAESFRKLNADRVSAASDIPPEEHA
jgi:hypothetical protein